MSLRISRLSLALTCALTFSGGAAFADAFILGSGRWTCEQSISVYKTGTDLQKGQLVGWILGTWTSATFSREKEFIDTVERVGGQKIVESTISVCGNAPPETLVYQIVNRMIRDTK